VSEKFGVATILRVVGQFYLHNTVANLQTFGRWGLVRVTQDAFNAGAIPDPLTDFRSMWYWNEFFYAESSTLGLEAVRQVIDTRNKRAIPMGSTLALMVESDSTSDGGAQFAVALRILYAVR